MDWLLELDRRLTRFLELGIGPSRSQTELLREMLREGLAEWKRDLDGLPSVRQVNIGGNCTGSMVITGDWPDKTMKTHNEVQ